jgi:hypothetical protein
MYMGGWFDGSVDRWSFMEIDVWEEYLFKTEGQVS